MASFFYAVPNLDGTPVGWYNKDAYGRRLSKSYTYDPTCGRFISQEEYSYLDPESINGLNLYAYCLNNATMCFDPSGHFVISMGVAALIAVAVSALVIGGAGQLAANANQGQTGCIK